MAVNTQVSNIITARFEELCLAGHFPQVQFKKTERGMSYSLMEYTEYRTRLCTLVHEQLQGLGFKKGIFETRLRSEKYLGAARSFASRFGPDDIHACTKRLRSWMD